MRRDAARLLHRQQTLERSLRELRGARGPQAQALRAARRGAGRGCSAGWRPTSTVRVPRCSATRRTWRRRMELARRAEAAVRAAGLELEGTRVVEAWGPDQRRDRRATARLLPECQARVDRATSMIGRARAALQRDAAELVPAFAGRVRAAGGTRASPPLALSARPRGYGDAMRIRDTLDYAATPERVFAMLSDQAFQERKAAATGALSTRSRSPRAATGTVIVSKRAMPTDQLPDFVKSIVGTELHRHRDQRPGARPRPTGPAGAG